MNSIEQSTFIKRLMKTNYIAVVLMLFVMSAPAMLRAQTPRFANPIVTSRDAPDPWVIRKDGFYYFTATTGGSIYVWKSPTLTGIDSGLKATVWSPPSFGATSRNVWAPELHFLNGKWYIYFAADDGDNRNHRMYVLEAATYDPQGAYIMRGKISAPTDRWAIDGTVFQKPDGSLYFLWSGWEGFTDGIAQNIYIAPMSNPFTITGERVLISAPPPSRDTWQWWINEAPQVITREGKTFVVFSANGSFTSRYCLGIVMNTDGDLLNPASWVKSTEPVFQSIAGVYGPGHNSFTKSPDGTEDWFVYHATNNETDGWNNRRPRAQKLAWNTQTGVPLFGYPVSPFTMLEVPAGETLMNELPDGRGTGLTGEYFDTGDFTDLRLKRTDPTVNFTWGVVGDTGAPLPTMDKDFFSVRWIGFIEPKFSEDYTFRTFADDGIRVYINNQLVIDDFRVHGPTLTESSPVRLNAGTRYPVRIEYFEYDKGATARFEWTSSSQALEVVPRSQLFPAVAKRRLKFGARNMRQ